MPHKVTDGRAAYFNNTKDQLRTPPATGQTLWRELRRIRRFHRYTSDFSIARELSDLSEPLADAMSTLEHPAVLRRALSELADVVAEVADGVLDLLIESGARRPGPRILAPEISVGDCTAGNWALKFDALVAPLDADLSRLLGDKRWQGDEDGMLSTGQPGASKRLEAELRQLDAALICWPARSAARPTARSAAPSRRSTPRSRPRPSVTASPMSNIGPSCAPRVSGSLPRPTPPGSSTSYERQHLPAPTRHPRPVPGLWWTVRHL